MDNKECRLLNDYINYILTPQRADAPDLGELDGDFRELGEHLQSLRRAVEETRNCLAALNAGDFSAEALKQDGFMNGELSQLRDTLQQLRMRDEEGEKNVQRKSRVIFSYNELLRALTRRQNEGVYISNEESSEIIYCNRRVQKMYEDSSLCQNCGHCVPFRDELAGWRGERKYQKWERQEDGGVFYQITTFPIEWQDRPAWAHLVRDITNDKKEKDNLKTKAYYDPLTGVYSRLYFMEYLEKVLFCRTDFIIGYLDLDGLKSINDHFGHNEGDACIQAFARVVKRMFRNTDVFARIGGDEFCIILENCELSVAKQKMEMALHEFECCDSRFPCSFSYGLLEVNGSADPPMMKDEILRRVDEEMYRCKNSHRTARDTVTQTPERRNG